MLASLQNRLRNGVLIAPDFGYFPPSEIGRVTGEVKPVGNACPQKR